MKNKTTVSLKIDKKLWNRFRDEIKSAGEDVSGRYSGLIETAEIMLEDKIRNYYRGDVK